MLEFIEKCWGVMSFWRSTMVGLCLLLMCAITRLKGKPYVKIQSFLNYFHLLSPLALKLHNSIFLFYTCIINLLWYVYILQFQCTVFIQFNTFLRYFEICIKTRILLTEIWIALYDDLFVSEFLHVYMSNVNSLVVKDFEVILV